MKKLLLCALVSLLGCKDYGRCLESHKETIVYYVQVGQVMIPVFNEDTICDRYEFPEGRP